MALPLEKFVQQLESSGLIGGDTLRDFLPPKASPKDAEELARELVRKQKLTKFQVEEISKGKGKSLVLGNYVLLEKIGAGGMGQVFKAEHRRMHRLVAIKLLPTAMTKDEAAIARFEREVTAAAKLRHTNIIAADDADQANGVHFLVMELVEGSDLSALVKKNGPFSVDRAVNYILQAARGLDYAHGKGVVHRDIKPANLLLGKDGILKILDMGLARIHGDAAQAELTSTGAVMGTVDYMAPEQALNTKTADARADIYALGCSLFYLLAGKSIYDGDTLMAKLLAHRDQTIPDLHESCPQVSEQLDQVFKKMVAKKIEDRYQTMTDVIAALENCGAGLSNTQTFHSTDAGQTIPGQDNSVTSRTATSALPTSQATQLSFVDVAADVTQSNVHTELSPKPMQRPVTKGESSPLRDQKKLMMILGATLGVVLLLVAIIFSNRSGTGKSNDTAKLLREEDKLAVAKSDAADKPWNTPAFQQWMKEVQGQPAEKQVEAVVKKLTDLNPEFDGKETHRIENGVVIDLQFLSDHVTDISPVRALAGLQFLDCEGSRVRQGKVSDLSPLQGMRRLIGVGCSDTQVSDLSPLAELPLLASLVCPHTPTADLSPLKLTSLIYLDVTNTPVSDLSPLNGLPLTTLFCNITKVTDLSAVRGMKLMHLGCGFTEVSSLAPLEGMNLTTILLTPKNIQQGMEVLRPMTSLKSISISYGEENQFTPDEFWKKYDSGEFSKPMTPVPASSVDSDRRAAEWVLSKKGSVVVSVNGTETTTRTLAELPKERFLLKEILLSGADKVNDAELSVLGSLTALRTFHCFQDRTLTDDGIAHLKGLTTLRHLDLQGQDLTDAGVKHLRGLTQLEHLNLLYVTQLTEKGLQTVKEFKNLVSLYYTSPTIENRYKFRVLRGPVLEEIKGLKHLAELCIAPLEKPEFYAPLREMTQLRGLQLVGPIEAEAILDYIVPLDLEHLAIHHSNTSATALVRIGGMAKLKSLRLEWDRFNDADLDPLKRLSLLETLSFVGSSLTDAGLTQIGKLKSLKTLNATATQLTAAGVASLHKTMPDCKIIWGDPANPMTVEPVDSVYRDRKAAEWALTKKGTVVVSVNGTESQFKTIADLPNARFQLKEIILSGADPVNDAELSVLEGLTALRKFACVQTGILTDAGMVHFKELTTLRQLDLHGNDVTDAGVAQLVGLKELENLNLSFTQVTEQGLRTIKEFKNLGELLYGRREDSETIQFLRGPALEQIKGLKHLWSLHLNALEKPEFYAPLGEMKQLRSLSIAGPAVTDAVIEIIAPLDLDYLAIVRGSISGRSFARLSQTKIPALSLGMSNFNEADLEKLKNLTGLHTLFLVEAPVTDAGLLLIGQLKNLREVDVRGTNVTAVGVARLQSSLPNSTIHWVDLTSDRRTAEWAVGKGARVYIAFYGALKTINEQMRAGLVAEDLLPKVAFELRTIDFDRSSAIADTDLIHLKGLKHLTRIDLRGTKVTPAGVASLQKALPNCGISWDDPAKSAKPLTDINSPAFQHWMKSVDELRAEKKVQAVVKKLQELNPGFDGKETHEIDNGVVRDFAFVSDDVTDISPVRSLVGLNSLNCSGSDVGQGILSDLSPLRGMALEKLSCEKTSVSDLSPLQGMPLSLLACDETQIADLSPLKGMPLLSLHCGMTQVSDLSPLEGMNLTEISVTPKNISKGIDIIHQMKTLTTIQVSGDRLPTADFWKKYIARDFGRPVPSWNTPEFQQWMKTVDDLRVKKQVEAVSKKLIELNPGFDGKVTPQIEGVVVTGLKFLTDNATDISPVRALQGLKSLECSASSDRISQLSDLSPLEGMALTRLECNFSKVFDLAPLKGMPLTSLDWVDSQVSDISPLQGMKLTRLRCNHLVTDLSPLKGMPLTRLECAYSLASDLSPLKGMQLTELICPGSNVVDLSPLQGMPLTNLNIFATQVSDLSPLQGMPLTSLVCSWTKVSDLTPLKDMPLTNLCCDRSLVSDLTPLTGMKLESFHFTPKEITNGIDAIRQMKTLLNIGISMQTGVGFPADEFWKKYDASEFVTDIHSPAFQQWMKDTQALPVERQVEAVSKKLMELNPGFDGKVAHKIDKGFAKELHFVTDTITDISPVRALAQLDVLVCAGNNGTGNFSNLAPLSGMSIKDLRCHRTKVFDLSPLQGMPIEHLECNHTQVADLTPLTKMPLKELRCYFTQVSDLMPLKGTPLKDLRCYDTQITDLSPLQGMQLEHLEISRDRVSDIMPLKGMPLRLIQCDGTLVSDLTPLLGMNLIDIGITPKNISSGIDIIRQMKSLKTIRVRWDEQYTPEEFWKKYDAGEFGKPGRHVDLIHAINLKNDIIAGQWDIRDTTLTTSGKDNSRLIILRNPPKEYDLELVIERKAEGQGVNVGFVIEGKQGMLVIDGFASIGGANGLEILNGKSAKENETTRRDKHLVLNKPSTILLQVRQTGVKCDWDGTTFIDWKGDADSFSMPSMWQIPEKNALFIGSQIGAEFHRISLTLDPLRPTP